MEHQRTGKSSNPLIQLVDPLPPRPQGFFEELLRSRPEVLVQDMDRHPERYPEEARAVLVGLVGGRRPSTSLTKEERLLLDQATFNFVQDAPAPKKVVPAPKQAQRGVRPTQIFFDDAGSLAIPEAPSWLK